MKSHHLCGVSLTLKNLLGLPANRVYGSPRFALHSPVRLPRILSDLAQICTPSIGLIDGITVLACNIDWSTEEYNGFGVIAWPNIEAIHTHVKDLAKIGWHRYIHARTMLGKKM